MTSITDIPTSLLCRLPAVLAAVAVTAVLLGCGDEPRTQRACVVVDVSPLPLRELTRSYTPGFQRFVQRVAENGSGDVCFAFAAQGISGGTSAWANFGCTNPDDRLRCAPEIRQKVAAAAAQLAAVGGSATDLHGASELVEAISVIAPGTAPGDEILLLSDAIQNSRLTGDFTRRRTKLDGPGIDRILDRIAERGLMPDLHGRRLRIPYALYRSDGALNMGAPRKAAVRAFWVAYAERANAKLVWAGGEKAA